jgi:hypothetical protein
MYYSVGQRFQIVDGNQKATIDKHSLARTTFHGRRGELRQRYREGQEDQLGALGLVVNILVLWTTLYMDRVLTQLRAQGVSVNDEDVERLSPLGSTQFNFYLDVFAPGLAYPAEAVWSAGSVSSPRSARSSQSRRLMAECRSTSRGQPRSTASSISCC